jgi:hypothetical protein
LAVWAGLEGKGEEQVAAALVADDKGAGADLLKAVAAVEGDGALVAGVGAEEQAVGAERAGVGDGGVEQGLAAAQAGDRFAGMASRTGVAAGAEARKEIDALEFDVAGEGRCLGELRRDRPA